MDHVWMDPHCISVSDAWICMDHTWMDPHSRALQPIHGLGSSKSCVCVCVCVLGSGWREKKKKNALLAVREYRARLVKTPPRPPPSTLALRFQGLVKAPSRPPSSHLVPGASQCARCVRL